MKKIVSLLLAFAPIALRAQPSWQIQSPAPSIYPLHSIQMLSPLSGWVCGYKGNVFHTVDAGQDWVAQPHYTRATLNALHFPAESDGWMVGDSGVILHTANGGASWVRQASGVDSALLAVSFADAANGWAVGKQGIILHTANGGQTWAAQNAGTTWNLHAVAFADRNTGWAVGDSNLILATANGGASWVRQASGISWPYQLTALHVVDAGRAWIAGFGGTVMKTVNGGADWTASTTNTTTNFRDIGFVGDTGWCVGMFGIYRTVNGGQTWNTRSPTFLGGHMTSISPTSGTTARYVGEGGRVVLCTNGFLNQAQEDVPTTNHLNCIWFADAGNGLACGFFGRIIRTTNGGVNWKLHPSGTTNELFAIQKVSATEAWAGGNIRGLLHSVDGGIAWSNDTAGISRRIFDVTAIRFVHPDTGWVGLATGKIFKTMNRGQTWTEQAGGFNNDVTSFYFLNAQAGWALSENRVARTVNGGQTWAVQHNQPGEVFRSLDFLDGSSGVAAASMTGISGINGILITNDGGANWTFKNLFALGDALNVKYVAPGVLWLYTDQQKIYQSVDRGDNWTLIHDIQHEWPRYYIEARSAFALDTANIWFAGANGGIVRYGSTLLTAAKPIAGASAQAETGLIVPNPGRGIFSLHLEGPARIEVFTADGRKLLALPRHEKGTLPIDLQQHGKGLFLVHVIAPGGARQVRKVVVQ